MYPQTPEKTADPVSIRKVSSAKHTDMKATTTSKNRAQFEF